MNIQSAKNHTTNMCLCICFGMHVFSCIFQHLPTTPPHQLNPTNPITTTQTPTTHTPCPALYIQQQPHYFWRGASSLPHPPTYISFI